MARTQSSGQEQFSRKGAAAYLTGQGFPVSPKTLAKWAINNNEGKGPPFVRFNGAIVIYYKSDLDTWAASRLERIE